MTDYVDFAGAITSHTCPFNIKKGTITVAVK